MKPQNTQKDAETTGGIGAMIRHVSGIRFCVFCVFCGLSLVGCGRKPQANPWAEVVTQVSTPRALEQGDVEGKRSLQQLLAYGDTGVGFVDGLQAAMIILDGKPYRIGGDGVVVPAKPEATTPYATVTFFAHDHQYDVAVLTRTVFEKTMDWKRRDTNMVYALKVKGLFREVVLQTVTDPEGAALADTAGTIVGFWYPPALTAVGHGGYQLFFVDEARARGGLVSDFNLTQGRIEVDEGDALQLLVGTSMTNAVKR